MRERIGWKSIPWSVNGNFDPLAQDVAIGPGKISFDGLEGKALSGLVVPVFAFSYNSEVPIADTVELALVNPNDALDRLVLYEDTNGGTTSFVEDNLGQGWPVPYISGPGGDRYELHFTTTGDAGEKRVLVNVWYMPVQSLETYRCYRGV